MPHLSRRSVLVALGASPFVLAGCGDGNSDPQGGFSVVEKGKLTFSMGGQYRPFNYYGSSGKLEGFDVEVGNRIAKELGLTPNPVAAQFDSLVGGLVAGRYDLIIGSMSPTPERSKVVDFTDTYYVSGAQLFVGPKSTIGSAADLKDAVIGVGLGTTFEKEAEKMEGVKDVRTYKNDQELLTDVSNGRIDGGITTKLLGLYLIKNAKLSCKAAGPILFDDPAAIAVNKKNPELKTKVNEVLKKMHSDGSYAEISTKWFGTDISVSESGGDSSSATS